MQKEVPTRQQAGPPGVQDQVWAKEQDRGLTSMSVTVQVIVIKETPRESVLTNDLKEYGGGSDPQLLNATPVGGDLRNGVMGGSVVLHVTILLACGS